MLRKALVSLLLIVMALCGCSDTAKPVVSVKPLTGEVKISNPTLPIPHIKRQYEVTLPGNITLTVTSEQTEYYSLYASRNGVEVDGALTQADGKTIFFDCDAVADRVIISGLVQPVQHYCESIIDADMKWRASGNANWFSDKDGHTWVRKP